MIEHQRIFQLFSHAHQLMTRFDVLILHPSGEEELIYQHEKMYENKREVCSHRIAKRDMATQGTTNPYMINNDYLEDLSNQDKFLRPRDSNIKSSDNKYLKED